MSKGERNRKKSEKSEQLSQMIGKRRNVTKEGG